MWAFTGSATNSARPSRRVWHRYDAVCRRGRRGSASSHGGVRSPLLCANEASSSGTSESTRNGKRNVKLPTPKVISARDARAAFAQLGGTGSAWRAFVNESASACVTALEASVFAFHECYSCVILCGRERLSGAVGLALASALKKSPAREHFGVAVVSVTPLDCTGDMCVQEEWQRLMEIAVNDGVDFMDDLPATFEFYYDLVIDAMCGTEQGDMEDALSASSLSPPSPQRTEQLSSLIDVLSSCEKPLACIDIPAGWDQENGPSAQDVLDDHFLKPDVLISLGAPKRPVRFFNGAWHFVASSRAQMALEKYLKDLGSDSGPASGLDFYEVDPELQYHLISSDLTKLRWGTDTGQIYGGGFMATTFTKKPRRKWIDVDETDDLFDDLD
ncbi:NAD(P)H-hydrate epimerase [Porphyridium purpureum]|uniref:NAD(P)H-hydrate epimerase n=1 Tax=Porphyridium purpureum TaxID=35688 RepID=A0A5J4Z0P0_PORPP|nr:NAD(P)H-hydrate epimerase [Porphyridium purpureum]|eukprot:POR1562..scf208_2